MGDDDGDSDDDEVLIATLSKKKRVSEEEEVDVNVAATAKAKELNVPLEMIMEGMAAEKHVAADKESEGAVKTLVKVIE